MHEIDQRLLEESFKKYYFDNFDLIHIPDRPSEREFGYQKFNVGMNRHISLKSDKELHLLLITNIPSDVYCSNAYYSFPTLPMAEKDWQGADLIFDIDSKDLNLNCRKDHTCAKCLSCNSVFQIQSSCPKCNSTKFDTKSLTCNMCISSAKDEVTKLYDILTNDLAIEEENIQTYFSGNEGFHIYVTNSQYQKLSSRERSELADYIMFRGVIPETFGIKKFNFEKSSFPELNEKGWRGKVAKQIIGSKSKKPKVIREIIAGSYTIFQKKLEDLKDVIGAKIDPNVTMDVHRIFRLAGSLNSKSGFSKVLCKNIEKFNPFADACLLDDETIEIKASCPIQFKLKNRKFGPYNDEKISVPKYAAVYMICKGLASTA